MTSSPVVYRGHLNDGGLVALAGTLISYGLIYSHLMSFLTSKAGISSTPAYLAVIALGLIMASGVFLRRSLPRSAMMVMAAVAAYAIILLTSLLFLDRSAGLLTLNRLFWVMVALAGTVLVSNIRSPSMYLLIVRVVVLLSGLILLAEFFSGFSLPVVMTTVRGRAGGLFENPNIAALFISMALPLVTIGLKPVQRVFWYGFTLTCVFLTFSRGGLAVCALAIMLIEVFPAQRVGGASLRRLSLGVLLVAIAVPLYLLISTFVVTNFGSQLDTNTLARARIESDSSSDIRLYVLRLAWEDFAASPFWGHGTGAGDRWLADVSVHNQFGLVAVEYGVIGLAWFGAFLAALWSIPRPFGIWATGLFAVASMTTHNLTDGPSYALILAAYVALPSIFPAQPLGAPAARAKSRHPAAQSNRRLSGPSGTWVRNRPVDHAFRGPPADPPAGARSG